MSRMSYYRPVPLSYKEARERSPMTLNEVLYHVKKHKGPLIFQAYVLPQATPLSQPQRPIFFQLTNSSLNSALMQAQAQAQFQDANITCFSHNNELTIFVAEATDHSSHQKHETQAQTQPTQTQPIQLEAMGEEIDYYAIPDYKDAKAAYFKHICPHIAHQALYIREVQLNENDKDLMGILTYDELQKMLDFQDQWLLLNDHYVSGDPDTD